MRTLLDAVRIGGIMTRNRICVPPMACFGWGEKDGRATERTVAHYRSFAQGGAGLIVQEATCVSREGLRALGMLGIWDDRHIDSLSRVVEAVHAFDCPILLQLQHSGAAALGDHPPAPDVYSFREAGKPDKISHRMSLDEIHRTQNDFISAGRRAWLAGYDGVQLHGAHRYLISQFLNCRVNRREDIYGWKPERFLLEILEGLRAVTPTGFVIGIRIGAFQPTLAEGLYHATVMESMGFDFLDISYGFYQEMIPPTLPESWPLKDVTWAARQIKRTVSIPVFTVQGLRTPKEAVLALELTGADIVNIGRSFLVDREWAKRALAGEETGRCLDCGFCHWHDGNPENCPGKKIWESR